MNQKQYKTPKIGGAAEIKKTFADQRKRKPSGKLLDILKKNPEKTTDHDSEKKIAVDHHPLKDVEL